MQKVCQACFPGGFESLLGTTLSLLNLTAPIYHVSWEMRCKWTAGCLEGCNKPSTLPSPTVLFKTNCPGRYFIKTTFCLFFGNRSSWIIYQANRNLYAAWKDARRVMFPPIGLDLGSTSPVPGGCQGLEAALRIWLYFINPPLCIYWHGRGGIENQAKLH